MAADVTMRALFRREMKEVRETLAVARSAVTSPTYVLVLDAIGHLAGAVDAIERRVAAMEDAR